jgi:hypothetical protein
LWLSGSYHPRFAWEHGKQIKVKHGDGGAIEGKGGYTDAPAADMKSCAWDGDNGLTKEQREAATLLGLDKQKWNNKVGPDFAWEEKMTMPEGKKPEETDEGKAVTANLAAAKKLGWSQKNWESVRWPPFHWRPDVLACTSAQVALEF